MEAVGIWIRRRITNSSWVGTKINKQLLAEVNEDRLVLNVIGRRREKLIGKLNQFLQIFVKEELWRKPRG